MAFSEALAGRIDPFGSRIRFNQDLKTDKAT